MADAYLSNSEVEFRLYKFNTAKQDFIPVIVFNLTEDIEKGTYFDRINYNYNTDISFKDIYGITPAFGVGQKGIVTQADKIEIGDFFTITPGTNSNYTLSSTVSYSDKFINLSDVNFYTAIDDKAWQFYLWYVGVIIDKNGICYDTSSTGVGSFNWRRDFNKSYDQTIAVSSAEGGHKGTTSIDSFPQFSGELYSVSHQNSNAWREFLGLTKLPDDPNSPYNGGDLPNESPEGQFDYGSDAIEEPDLPNTSVTDSGFVSLYAPTESQLKALCDYLWSDAFSLDTFKKIFNNPMDCILGLNIIPVNVPTGSAREITVGNIISTVSCNTVTQQYVRVDCGTFTFLQSQFTGGYLDFSPYTKCYLYLPFIGTEQIDIDEFMGATMHVTYHVDILTGAMFAYVMRVSGGVSSVIYTYMGQCAENVPLSSTSYSNTIGSILNAAAAIGGVVATAATGGAAAPVALGLLAGASTATANAASSMKPSIQHSGSVGGGAGIMGVNYPYVIFIAPRTAYDQSQYKYTGLPNNKAVKLSSLSGFTIIQAINLSIDGATQQEINEIESGLKEGVIL